MASDFLINPDLSIKVMHIGNDRQPVIIVENFFLHPDSLIDYAATGEVFQKEARDFYPGIRKPLTNGYSTNLRNTMEETLREVFKFSDNSHVEILSCVLSLATTPPKNLRPIQSVPHIDSYDNNMIAAVHYLCQPHHGGTSFYRHRRTGYETLNEQKLQHYAPMLKSEVMADQSKEPGYMNGDTALFERIAYVEAKFNRAIFYRSSLLHSGNIQAENGLSEDPRTGRLTANTLIYART